jgi:hypothetical protein
MHKLKIALLLLTMSTAAADDEGSRVSVRASGDARDILLVPAGGARMRVIVEFTSPPLVLLPRALHAHSDARATLERFRRDLTPSLTAHSGAPQRAAIEHEYTNTLSGAAIVADHETLALVRRLPYVSRVGGGRVRAVRH